MSTHQRVIWRLSGRGGANIICVRQKTASGLNWLRIMVAQEILVEECYANSRSATSRARALRERLKGDGICDGFGRVIGRRPGTSVGRSAPL